MEREKLLQSDYLDIIFDQRNKAYGGYELRKNYSRRTRNASSIVLFAAAVGFAIPALAGMLKKPVAIVPRPVVITPTILHPVVDPVKPLKTVVIPPTPPKPPLAEVFVPPVIIQDKDVRPEEQLVQNDKLKNAMISNVHNAGDETSTDISIAVSNVPGTGDGKALIETPHESNNEPAHWVEQMPVYNGDMYAFLNSHIVYPPAARENGIAGRVVIQFVINEDGSVSNATVEKSISPDLDNEALRVVKSMPHWKPGKQNGRPVKVYFSLPVTFALN